MFEKYIDNLKDEIISETCNLINIPSVSEETNDPNMPFGVHSKEAIDTSKISLSDITDFIDDELRTLNFEYKIKIFNFFENILILNLLKNL